MVCSHMEIIFEDARLRWVETSDWKKSKVPAHLIERLRIRLHTIRMAPDERTLREWKSLHFEKLSGDRDGYWSIRIREQWRLVFQIDKTEQPPKMRVFSVEDYH